MAPLNAERRNGKVKLAFEQGLWAAEMLRRYVDKMNLAIRGIEIYRVDSMIANAVNPFVKSHG